MQPEHMFSHVHKKYLMSSEGSTMYTEITNAKVHDQSIDYSPTLVSVARLRDPSHK